MSVSSGAHSDGLQTPFRRLQTGCVFRPPYTPRVRLKQTRPSEGRPRLHQTSKGKLARRTALSRKV